MSSEAPSASLLRRLLSSPNPRTWAFALLTIGIIERIAFWLIYTPQTYGDTGSYLRVAGVLSNLSLEGYDGTRLPGYPAFLALMGREAEIVWIGQMALGLLISLILFWTGWRLTASPAIGFLAGLLYDLSPGQIFFEANLLSETLTAFWIVSSTALLLALWRLQPTESQARAAHTSGFAILIAILLGITSSMAGLTRPLFYFLPLFLLPFVWLFTPGASRRRMMAFTVPVVILLGGWLLYMRSAYHVWSPSALTGFHLVQHSGEFFEHLPDEYADIRDTFLLYREEHIQRTGVGTNAIWDAIPEMAERSGWSFYELGRELQRLSIQLIARHPAAYLRNVFEGWVGFWKAPVYWRAEGLEAGVLVPAVRAWASVARGITVLFNFAFLALSGLVILSKGWRPRLGVNGYVLALGGLVWASSIVQSLTEHGDNHRFLVPLQLLVVLLVMSAGWSFYKSGRDAG